MGANEIHNILLILSLLSIEESSGYRSELNEAVRSSRDKTLYAFSPPLELYTFKRFLGEQKKSYISPFTLEQRRDKIIENKNNRWKFGDGLGSGSYVVCRSLPVSTAGNFEDGEENSFQFRTRILEDFRLTNLLFLFYFIFYVCFLVG